MGTDSLNTFSFEDNLESLVYTYIYELYIYISFSFNMFAFVKMKQRFSYDLQQN